MINSLVPEFMENVPHDTQDGVLYISIRYSLAIHRCCCGCGKEVTTKLSPSRWTLKYDGETVSLWPSIGNWDFPCKSHYWIERNKIHWVGRFSDKQIEEVRESDLAAELEYISRREVGDDLPALTTARRHRGIAGCIRRLLRRHG